MARTKSNNKTKNKLLKKKRGKKKKGKPKNKKDWMNELEIASPKFIKTTTNRKYDPKKMIPIVMSEMANGASRAELALALGTTPWSIWNWINKYPEFEEAMKVGDKLCRAWWLRQGRINLWNKQFNWTGYMMNMQNRFGWSRNWDGNQNAVKKYEHEHTYKHELDLTKLEVKELEDLRDIIGKAKDDESTNDGSGGQRTVHSLPPSIH